MGGLLVRFGVYNACPPRYSEDALMSCTYPSTTFVNYHIASHVLQQSLMSRQNPSASAARHPSRETRQADYYTAAGQLTPQNMPHLCRNMN
jgi:hypothetical protein